MPGGEIPAQFVIHPDAFDIQRFFKLIHNDDRDIRPLQFSHIFIRIGVAEDDKHAVYRLHAQKFHLVDFLIHKVIAVAEQQIVVLRLEFFSDEFDEFGEKEVADIGNDQPDGHRLFRDQTLRRLIRLIIHFARCFQYQPALFFTHAHGFSIQNERNRGDGHIHFFSDIFQQYRHNSLRPLKLAGKTVCRLHALAVKRFIELRIPYKAAIVNLFFV